MELYNKLINYFASKSEKVKKLIQENNTLKEKIIFLDEHIESLQKKNQEVKTITVFSKDSSEEAKIKELESKLNSVLRPEDKIETIVSKYCLGIIGIIYSGNFDYERFKKTALRISENIQRMNQLAQNYKVYGQVDESIKAAIESWAKKESTPKYYKELFK